MDALTLQSASTSDIRIKADQFSDMLTVDKPYRLAFQQPNYESFKVNKLKRKRGVISNYVTILNGKK